MVGEKLGKKRIIAPRVQYCVDERVILYTEVLNSIININITVTNGKHVTGRGGPYDYETSRLPHYLDNRRSFQPYAPAALYPHQYSRYLCVRG
jgi:hypothetical protein